TGTLPDPGIRRGTGHRDPVQLVHVVAGRDLGIGVPQHLAVERIDLEFEARGPPQLIGHHEHPAAHLVHRVLRPERMTDRDRGVLHGLIVGHAGHGVGVHAWRLANGTDVRLVACLRSHRTPPLTCLCPPSAEPSHRRRTPPAGWLRHSAAPSWPQRPVSTGSGRSCKPNSPRSLRTRVPMSPSRCSSTSSTSPAAPPPTVSCSLRAPTPSRSPRSVSGCSMTQTCTSPPPVPCATPPCPGPMDRRTSEPRR